jgi:hypothetical protein
VKKKLVCLLLYGALPYLLYSAIAWRRRALEHLPVFRTFHTAWQSLSYPQKLWFTLASFLPSLSLILAAASWAWGLWVARPALRWRPLPVQERRIVLVNDLSASMQGAKEETLRRATRAFFEALFRDPHRENLRVGVVIFSGQAKVLLPLVRVGEPSGGFSGEQKERLFSVLSSMSTLDPAMGDGTELGEGLWTGLELIVRYGRREDPLLLGRWRRLKEAILRGRFQAGSPESAQAQWGTHKDSVLVAFTDGFVEGEKLSSAAVFSLAKALGIRTYFLSVEAVPAFLASTVDRALGHLALEESATLESLYREIASREARPSFRESMELDLSGRREAMWLGFFFFGVGILSRCRAKAYVP